MRALSRQMQLAALLGGTDTPSRYGLSGTTTPVRSNPQGRRLTRREFGAWVWRPDGLEPSLPEAVDPLQWYAAA